MSRHMKKIAVAIAFTLTSGIAMAESDVAVSKDETFVKKIEKKIHKSSPSLSRYEVSLDSISEDFKSKVGDDLVPIVFTGKRYLVDSKGDFLIEPSSTIYLGGESIEPMSSMLISLDMKSENFSDNYISHKLPEGVNKKADLYVLTDPTCGYCHEIEKEIDVYLNNGIQVHLLPYPRSGIADINQAAMARWASAACSDEPAVAYRNISLGDLDTYPQVTDINAECVDVIKKGYAYGRKIGIGGTPFMFGVSENGEKTSNPGYLPAQDFASKLGIFIKEDVGLELTR